MPPSTNCWESQVCVGCVLLCSGVDCEKRVPDSMCLSCPEPQGFSRVLRYRWWFALMLSGQFHSNLKPNLKLYGNYFFILRSPQWHPPNHCTVHLFTPRLIFLLPPYKTIWLKMGLGMWARGGTHQLVWCGCGFGDSPALRQGKPEFNILQSLFEGRTSSWLLGEVSELAVCQLRTIKVLLNK